MAVLNARQIPKTFQSLIGKLKTKMKPDGVVEGKSSFNPL